MTVRIYGRTSIDRFTFPSIATDSTGGGEMELLSGLSESVHSGILQGVCVSCDSSDFSVSIRDCSNGQSNTPDELYKVTGISVFKREANLGVGWVNADSPMTNKLYLVIVNNDSANATGEINIVLVNDIHRKFAK